MNFQVSDATAENFLLLQIKVYFYYLKSHQVTERQTCNLDELATTSLRNT